MKNKHWFQHLAAAMACLMLCVLSMPGAALAAGQSAAKVSYHQLTAEEMARKCSIELHYTTANTSDPQPLPETEFRLYKVADMNSNVQFTVTDEFSGYPVFTPAGEGYVKINELDAAGWVSLANTLAGYVSRDSEKLIPVSTIRTDAQGIGTFTDLSIGLYLLIGDRSVVGNTTYTPTPVLVALPYWNAASSSWEFDVQSNVKYTDYTPSTETTTVQRRVLKIWEDDGYENVRPEEVVVELLCNGEVYDTVILNADNNWRASWTGLSPDDQWQLTERLDSEDYMVSVEQEGVTFVVTNTYLEELEEDEPPLAERPDIPDEPEEPDIDLDDPDVPTTDKDLRDPVEEPDTPARQDPPDEDVPDDEIDLDDPDVPLADKLPQTGQLWWPVPILAVGGVGAILAGVIRRRNKNV